MKILVLTGNDRGMDSIGALTAANHQAYALRHGYTFERFTDYPADCHPSWHKLALLRERLPKYDAILWLDADTVVTQPAMRIEEIIGDRKGLIVSKDWTNPAPEDAIKHFSLGNFVFTNSPGSFEILEKASARTEWTNRGLWEQQAIQEEYRANESIRKHVHILPRRTLNAVPATRDTTGPEPWEPGDFLCHLTYLPNEERVTLFWGMDLSGIRTLLPDLPEHHETVMCADARHIACMKELVERGGFKRALEIGVWTGAMTSGFFPALRSGALGSLLCCDIQFQDDFQRVIAGVPNIDLDERSSHAVLQERGGEFDMIFVDGCHELDCVREEARLLLKHHPRLIAAHDVTAAINGFAGCEGAMILHSALQGAGYICQLDCRQRDGEKTPRGFLLASKEPGLIELANRCLAMTCY